MANMASACALMISSRDSSSKLFGPLRVRWRTKEAASSCVLVTISAVCICILVVCGVLLAREYSLARPYEQAACTVTNVTETSVHKSCQCSGHKDKTVRDCIPNTFPCIQVHVLYSTLPTSGRSSSSSGEGLYDALLHHDSLQAAGIHRDVSREWNGAIIAN